MTETIIFSILSLIVGAAVGYLLSHAKAVEQGSRASFLENENASLKQQLQQKSTSIDELTQERQQLSSRSDVLQSQVDTLKALNDKQQADSEKQLSDVESRYQRQLADLKQQQREQLEQQSTLIREQINTASEEILKKRQDELASTNKEQLAAILNPLHENLRQMKEAVERSDKEQAMTMARLDASIQANLKQAEEVGERADKLAQALTSENKTQGNFGELRLRTLLEQMGLEEGTQFEEQSTLRDAQGKALHDEESGKRMIPDVILHFPDERDVIIDSKMSLKAFEDYYNAETDEEKADALARHIASVRSHVKELASKTYSAYLPKGHQKLDFVVMYIFSESALQLALANDPSLWKWAYDQGVVISGSQNLYMMLRVLQMTWRQVRQAENQDEIMKAANEVINRVQMFYERFQAADEQLTRTRNAFDALKTTTAPSGKGIITAANHLLQFGAQENTKRKYKLPKEEDGLE